MAEITTDRGYGPYADHIVDMGRLTERQVARILADHSLTFVEFDADNEWDADTDTWDATSVVEWLGY